MDRKVREKGRERKRDIWTHLSDFFEFPSRHSLLTHFMYSVTRISSTIFSLNRQRGRVRKRKSGRVRKRKTHFSFKQTYKTFPSLLKQTILNFKTRKMMFECKERRRTDGIMNQASSSSLSLSLLKMSEGKSERERERRFELLLSEQHLKFNFLLRKKCHSSSPTFFFSPEKTVSLFLRIKRRISERERERERVSCPPPTIRIEMSH